MPRGKRPSTPSTPRTKQSQITSFAKRQDQRASPPKMNGGRGGGRSVLNHSYAAITGNSISKAQAKNPFLALESSSSSSGSSHSSISSNDSTHSSTNPVTANVDMLPMSPKDSTASENMDTDSPI